jgi:hypothetical protein
MVPPSGREVPAAATLTVDHEAYLGRVCGDGFAVMSRMGEISVLDGRLRVVRRLDLDGAVADLSIFGGRWAWVMGARLRIGDPDTDGDSAPLPGAPACRWTSSGQGLWVAEGTGDQVRVELRTPEGRVTRAVTVPDSFGDSMVRLRHHPHADKVVLWLTAGRDGQQSWLVHDDGTALTAAHLPADDCLPALFTPAGDRLVTAGDAGLTMLSWPDRVELSALSWSDIEKDGGDTPGDCLMALPGGFVSWSTGNGRLHVIDLATMSVVDEITLAGHPVQDDGMPRGDFAYTVPHGNGTVLSVHEGNTLVLSALRDWTPTAAG